LRLTITRQQIERRVLEGLKGRLLAPDLMAAFVQAFQEEVKRERDALKAERSQRERKIAEVERKIAGILRAIEDGLYEPAMKARLAELTDERDRLKAVGPGFDEPNLDLLLHPSACRRLSPSHPRADGSALDAALVGALAALQSVCAEVSGNKKPPAAGPSRGHLSVVAGARNLRDLSLNCRI
jgi:hypothetical protein